MERYEKIKKIGEGSFGKALLVRRKSDRRQCVVKEINIARMSPKEKEESRKEVKVLSQLKHPNIVTYQESFEEFGNLLIVMDYCEGGDLYQKIVNQRGINFSEDQVLDYFVQICLGLKHIHDRKILHRDLKSQNIFLTKHGIVKLGDFGIARVLKSTMELARTCIGTPYYLSPEICENRPYNNKSDIWSLGCVLYELCTLKHAFESGNMKNLVLKIIRGSYPPLPNRYSPDMRNLVAHCFKRSASDRPSVNTILKKPFIQDRIRKFLSPEVIEEEFSHTVLHKGKPVFAKPLAPGIGMGRPPSQVSKRGRDPAAIYGVSVAKKPVPAKKGPVPAVKKVIAPVARSGDSQVRSSAEKRKDMEARERRRKNLISNQEQAYQDYIKKIQKQRWEKQQRENINRAREDGWKNLLGSDESAEARKKAEVKGDAQNIMVKQGKPMEKYMAKQEEKPMEKYMAKQEEKAMEKYMAKQEEKPPVEEKQVPVYEPPRPRAVSAYEAQVYGREAGERGQGAAEKARLVEEFWQRKREAAMNKARGNQEVFSKPYMRKPAGQGVGEANFGRPRAAAGMGRNQQEQEYLRQLEAIRKQNFYERLNQQKCIPPPAIPQPNHKPLEQNPEVLGKPLGYNVGDPRYDPELRRKKIAALKEQADQRAVLLREQLDKRRKVLQDKLNQERLAREKEKDQREQQLAKLKEVVNKRPFSAQENAPCKVPNMEVPAVGIDTAMGQLEKVKLFRSCSEGDIPEIKKIVQNVAKERKHWNGVGIAPIAALPLEMTASEMEATSDVDLVFRPGNQRVDPRRCWNPDGKTQLVSLLHRAELATGSTVPETLITTGKVSEPSSPVSPSNVGKGPGLDKKSPENSPNCAFHVDMEGNIRGPISPRKSSGDHGLPSASPRSIGSTYRVPDSQSKSGSFGATVIKRPLPPRPKLSDAEEEEEAKKEEAKTGQTQNAWSERSYKREVAAKQGHSPRDLPGKEQLFQAGKKEGTPSKPNEDLQLEDVGEDEESFHTPCNHLLENRSQGLRTGCYDTDRQLLRTCSLPDLTKVGKAIEDLNISGGNESDAGSKKDTSNESSDSLADDEGDEVEERRTASGPGLGLPVRNKAGRGNGADTGDAEDEADEEEYTSQTQEEEEEIEDLEKMLNSMRHVLNSSAGKTPPSTTPRDAKESSPEESPREEQVRSSIMEDWDSDEGDEDQPVAKHSERGEKRQQSKESMFQRIEESRQALEEELGAERFLKVYRYIQAIQENDDDELNVSLGPENEVMDLLGPDKERLYQKVLYLVMADAAYFEGNN